MIRDYYLLDEAVLTRLYTLHDLPDRSDETPGASPVLNDGDDRALPAEVAEVISTEVYIHGQFEVCPLAQSKPKQMQMVCLISAKNLITRKIF